MTDYRRPDLDLWEEDDDVEDARPTIVSERPVGSPGPKTLLQGIKLPALGQQRDKPQDEGDRITPDVGRVTPEIGRVSLVKRLIAQGALEDDALPRESVESLRDSDIAALRISQPVSAKPPSLPKMRPEVLAEADDGSEGEGEAVSEGEAEDVTDELVPTVATQKPQALPPPVAAAKTLPLPTPRIPTAREREVTERIALEAPAALPLPAPRSSRDREVTERISTEPSAQTSSLAPTAHTVRPAERESTGFPWWQGALAALVLLGGGLGIAQLRRANQPAGEVVAARQTQRDERPVEPSMEPSAAVERPAEPAVSGPPAPEPLATAPTLPAAPSAPAPLPAQPVAAPSAPSPKPALAPRRPRAEKVAPASVDEEGQAPVAAREAATPQPASDQPLPSQPSRDQVTAALNAIVPELQKCVGDRHGTADVTMTVRSAGVVSYAVVAGMYSGTPEGSCLARAVKSAKFPAFSDPVLRVTYPFQL